MAATSGYQRQVAFAAFRRFLAAHGAAEEETVHPAACTGAGVVVEQRLAEEYQAEQQITALSSWR